MLTWVSLRGSYRPDPNNADGLFSILFQSETDTIIILQSFYSDTLFCICVVVIRAHYSDVLHITDDYWSQFWRLPERNRPGSLHICRLLFCCRLLKWWKPFSYKLLVDWSRLFFTVLMEQKMAAAGFDSRDQPIKVPTGGGRRPPLSPVLLEVPACRQVLLTGDMLCLCEYKSLVWDVTWGDLCCQLMLN